MKIINRVKRILLKGQATVMNGLIDVGRVVKRVHLWIKVIIIAAQAKVNKGGREIRIMKRINSPNQEINKDEGQVFS